MLNQPQVLERAQGEPAKVKYYKITRNEVLNAAHIRIHTREVPFSYPQVCQPPH